MTQITSKKPFPFGYNQKLENLIAEYEKYCKAVNEELETSEPEAFEEMANFYKTNYNYVDSLLSQIINEIKNK